MCQCVVLPCVRLHGSWLMQLHVLGALHILAALRPSCMLIDAVVMHTVIRILALCAALDCTVYHAIAHAFCCKVSIPAADATVYNVQERQITAADEGDAASSTQQAPGFQIGSTQLRPSPESQGSIALLAGLQITLKDSGTFRLEQLLQMTHTDLSE